MADFKASHGSVQPGEYQIRVGALNKPRSMDIPQASLSSLKEDVSNSCGSIDSGNKLRQQKRKRQELLIRWLGITENCLTQIRFPSDAPEHPLVSIEYSSLSVFARWLFTRPKREK